MVARRSNSTESIFGLFVHEHVHGQNAGARRTQRCLPGKRVHGRIGIQVRDTKRRRGILDFLNMRSRMHQHQLFQRGQRRFVMRKIHVNTLRDQMILNCRQAGWRLRMKVAHVMFQTVRMCNKRRAHT